MHILQFVSRFGTRIIAASAFIGLLFPDLTPIFRPALGHFVVVMLAVSLLRVDIAAFQKRMRRPISALAASVWMVLVWPASLMVLLVAIGPPFDSPIVLAIVFLFSGPSAIVSAPAFAMLMGLDGALVLAVLLLSTVLVPITAPWLTSLFAAEILPIGAVDLAGRLAGMIAISFAAAAVLRRWAGPVRIERAKPLLDTISVAIAIMFAIGAMDGVAPRVLSEPGFVALALAASFAFSLVQMALTYILFRPFVGTDAVAIAYATASRNGGLFVAALGVSAVDDTLWLFFALSQLPLFFFPLILQPIGRRLTEGRNVPVRKSQ